MRLYGLGACGLAVLLAGCAVRSEHVLIRLRSQATGDYADEVTHQQFRDHSNLVEVEVVRFASVTSRHVPRGVAVSAATRVAQVETSMKEALGSRPTQAATGVRLARTRRDVAVSAPMIGTHETGAVSRGIASARVVGGTSPLRYASWREVLAAEVRTRVARTASATGVRQAVQWPHGVHEVISDASLSSILMREDIAGAKAPIVVLDFLTRFKQRPKLVLTKAADRERAFVGEVVAFTVTFFNDSPVEAQNVVIADIVDEQCEYRPKSAQCARDHTFSVEQTADKRAVLVWRLKDPVKPHEAGTITYKLVVRKAWVR